MIKISIIFIIFKCKTPFLLKIPNGYIWANHTFFHRLSFIVHINKSRKRKSSPISTLWYVWIYLFILPKMNFYFSCPLPPQKSDLPWVEVRFFFFLTKTLQANSPFGTFGILLSNKHLVTYSPNYVSKC